MSITSETLMSQRRRGASAARVITAITIAFAICACNDQRVTAPHAETPPATPTLVDQARTFHHSAPCIAAALLVKVKPEGRDSLTFTINIWATADGRVRLQGSKVGFSGFEALTQADGQFVVLAGDEACRDDLEAAFANELGPNAQLARLVEELTLGPVPGAETLTVADRTLSGTDPATAQAVTVELAPDSTMAIRKIWRVADGRELMRLEYSRYKAFEALQRPSLLRVVIADHPGEFLIRVQSIDVLPAVSDSRMTLAPAATAKPLPFADFLKRLGE